MLPSTHCQAHSLCSLQQFVLPSLPLSPLPSQDADSLDPSTNKKSEGAFYVWSDEEIRQVLGDKEQAALFCEVYGVQEGGNCTLSARSDPHQEFVGKNVLAQVNGGPDTIPTRVFSQHQNPKPLLPQLNLRAL